MPTFPTPTERARAVDRARQRLQTQGFPRLQMALLVALTGGFGLLASFCLLQMGLDTMALRYPVAVLLAYLFFLLLVWLWLRTRVVDYADLTLDVPLPGPRGATAPWRSGGGGDFAGGGASASFDSAAEPVGRTAVHAAEVADADVMAVPLLALAAISAMAFASLYLVYIAPLLFAEVLVDGALSYALFRHLRGLEPQHWLSAAVRRSVLPFLATAVFMAAAGAALAWVAPGAHSVGEVLAQPATR